MFTFYPGQLEYLARVATKDCALVAADTGCGKSLMALILIQLKLGSFIEDPVTGARYAQQGNSLLPSGINPAKQTNEAFDITDGDGNVVSRGVRGPKGTIQLIRTPPPTQVAKDAEATNKSWMDRLQKANAEVESLREAALGAPSTDEERDVAAYKKLRAATLKLQEIQAQEPKFAPPKAAAGGGDRVKVVNKAGQVGWIPKAQLNDALKKGYSLDERRN